MATIKLPQAGKAPAATVRRWRKNTGDAVAKGDVLLEVETEDGLVYVEAPADGRLTERLVSEGKTIAVGTPIGSMEASSAPVAPKQESKPVSSQASKAAGKVTPIVMPKAGQSMEEGTIVKWLVQPGATIKQGQAIFEIETDKATMEVEATDAGRLSRIVLAEGGAIKCLEPVAYLAENDADVDAFIASQGGAAPAAGVAGVVAASAAPADAAPAVSAPAGQTESGRVKASPAARRIASERGIDLASIGMGSGPGGRIISTDVPATAKAAPTTAARPVTAATPVITGEVVRKRMSGMRKAIARNLSLSKQTIPHFYIKATINAEAMQAFYQGEKAKYPCSINDVVVLACAKCIMEFPQFRSRIDGEEIIEFPSANIGIAVGMDEGLVVPVVVGAEKLTLKQLGPESKRLANNAKGGKIEGMGKGVFTITNMGMFGVEEFNAIINPPEAAILAVGAIREEVIVSGGTLKAGRVMTVTLSVDHRVIDGALAAKFLARLKELLEWPALLA